VNNAKYIANKNSKVVHSGNCSYLPKEENQLTYDSLETAIADGYTDRCDHCLGE